MHSKQKVPLSDTKGPTREESTLAAKEHAAQPGPNEQPTPREQAPPKEQVTAKEQAERAAKEQAAKEQAAKEQAERAAKERAAKEQAERAAKEQAAKEQAERAAKERAERAAKEQAAKEQAERAAKERAAARERAAAAERAAARDRVAKEAAREEAARAAREEPSTGHLLQDQIIATVQAGQEAALHLAETWVDTLTSVAPDVAGTVFSSPTFDGYYGFAERVWRSNRDFLVGMFEIATVFGKGVAAPKAGGTRVASTY
jgi:membrane protein involved in colicin uptake